MKPFFKFPAGYVEEPCGIANRAIIVLRAFLRRGERAHRFIVFHDDPTTAADAKSVHTI